MDVVEHLQQENHRLHSVIKLMTEELKELHETSKTKNTLEVLHKATETDCSMSDSVVSYLKSELEELEKELESAYNHIQMLEDQRETPHALVEEETVYLREKVSTTAMFDR